MTLSVCHLDVDVTKAKYVNKTYVIKYLFTEIEEKQCNRKVYLQNTCLLNLLREKYSL